MKTHTPNSTRQPSMKNTRKPRRILTTSAAVLLGASLMLGTAQAYNPNFWDVNGVAVGFGGTGIWDNNTTANWNNATGIAAPQNWINPIVNNNAIFQGTTGVVTLSGTDGPVIANSIIFAPTTFAAGAPLGYILNGPGILAMSGAGTIQLGAAASPDSTTVINAVLSDVGGSGITVSSFLGTATSVLTLGNAANTFTGVFTVTSGTVNLTGSANTSISGSGLVIGTGAGALGSAVVNGAGNQVSNTALLTINNSGVYNLTGFETVGNLTGGATAVINLSVAGGIGVLDNTSQTYAGAINGTGGAATGAIQKGGTGTLTLTGASNFTGITFVQTGVLNVANGTALGAVDVGAGTANGTAVTAGATLQLSGGINVGNESLTLAGAGTGAAGQEGALVNLAGNNTFGGRLIFTGATTISNNAGASTFALTNTSQVTGAVVLTLNSSPIGGAANTNTLAGGLNALTGLVVTSNNTNTTWTLTGNNGAFAGPITVNSGTLVAGSANAFGNGTVAVTLNNTGIAGNLNLNGNSQTIGSLTGAAGTAVTNGAGAAGPATLTFGNATSTTFNGAFTDAGAALALSLVKTGTGTFTMGGTTLNTYNGLTTVAQGTLLLTNTGATPLGAVGAAASGTVVNAGATLALSGGVVVGGEFLTLTGTGDAGVGALNNVAGTNTFGGPITLGGATTITSTSGNLLLTNVTALAGGGALTLAGAGNGTIAGQLSLPVITSVTKNGTGTWTLGASNTYIGATTVTAGTLKAGAANAFGFNSAVNLTTAGATLDLGGFANAIGSLTGVLGTTLTNSAVATPALLTTGADNTSTTFNGVITDTGAAGALSLTKTGTGTFTLTGASNYNGLTTVFLGALNIQNATALGAATGTAATGTTVTAGATLQLQGGIGVGNEALTLAGAGTGAANQDGALVNVSGVNLFGGPLTMTAATTISSTAGTLNLTNATAIAGAGGALTLNSAVAAGNGNLAAALGANIASVTKNGGGTWFLSGTNTYTGATTVNSGTLAAGSSTAFGASSPVVLTGAGILDINGNSVAIGSLNSASATTVVTNSGVAATLTTGALNTADSYIGTITGALALTKTGTGTFTIGGTGTNTYTGLTTVTGGGILQITSTGTNPLGAVGTAANGTVVQAGSTLQLAGGGVAIGNEFLTIAGTGAAGSGGALNNQSGTNAFGGPITLSAASTINVTAGVLNLTSVANLTSAGGPFALTLNSAAAATGNLSGIIDSGISAVNKTGAGTWRLIGASTYTGPTNVTGGVLQAGVATVGGATPTSGAFGINSVTTVTAPSILDLNGFNTTVGSLAGNGTVDNTAAGPVTLTTGTAGSTAFTGVIQNTAGALGLTKVGAGTTFTLSGANTYTGLTTVAQGILLANNAQALGAGSAVPAAANTGPGTTVSNGAALVLNGLTVGLAATPETLTIVGAGTGAGAPGALTQTAGLTSTFIGAIFVDPTNIAGGATISTNGAGTLTLGNVADPALFINKTNVNLILTGGGTINVNESIIGNIVGYNDDLFVTGVTTNLNVANTYLGPTHISSNNVGGGNGILNANVVNALPTAFGRTAVDLDQVFGGTGGSTLNIAANNSAASLVGAATSKVTLVAGNTLTIGFGAVPNVNGTANANFAGVISGAGNIAKDDASTQIFSGLNTYTGTTTVINGKLQAGIGQAGAAGAFGNSSNVTVGTATTVVGSPPILELAGFNETIGSLSGLAAAGGFVQNNFGPVGSNATLTLGSGGGSGNFGGIIQDAPVVGAVGAGTLSIIKIGGGTQIFSGINTYTGTTTVNNGTLQAGSIQAFGVNSVTTVNAPGILELGGFSNTIDSLFGNGTVQNTITGPASLTLSGAAGNAAAFSGNIADTAGTPLLLVINDVNALGASQSLSGQSTWVGGTTLNAGRLNIDASDIFGAVPLFGTPPSFSGPLGLGTLTINGGTIGSTTAAGNNNAVGVPVQVNASFAVAGANGIADGVTFAGAVNLNNAGVTTITTNSGFLDFSGTITGAASGGLTFAGSTFTYIGSAGIGGIPGIFGQGDLSNTYTGTTTVGDGINASFVLLGKNSGAVAIPGNLVIAPFSTVQFDSFAVAAFVPTTPNQIATTSNVTVNGILDISGFNQAINALTGTGVVRLDDSAANNLGAVGIFTVNSGNFGGSIVDAGLGGQLVKNSTGLLILSGTNPYVGTTTVNAGNLQVNGFIGSANTFVNFGGTLSGIGVIGGNVINSGTVSPGTSPGKLTVTGNYTQTAAGTLLIEVAGKNPGQFDVLAVGGAANLNGTVRILNTGSVRLKRNQKVTFLTAGGGVNGKFSTENVDGFTDADTLLKAKVAYKSNSVQLTAKLGSFSNDISGLTPNQKAVARELDRAEKANDQDRLLDFLSTEHVGNIPHDLDLIAPEELASIFNIGVSLANVQSANLQRRMSDIQAGATGFSSAGYSMGGTAYSGSDAGYTSGATSYGARGPEGKGGKEIAPPSENRWGVFVNGVGEFTNIGNTYNARGYDLTTGGFTIGADYKITPNLAIGIHTGYARTGAELTGNGRVEVDGAKLGLYATYFTGTGFYADAAVAGGYNSYDTRRGALRGTARGSTNGGEFNALFATGYDWKTGGLSIGPVASVQYTNVSLNSFRERGSLAPLNIANQSGESLRTALGMKASYDIPAGGVVIRPEVRAAWQHEFGDSSFALDSRFANGGGNTFTVHGPEIGEDSLLLSGGVAVLWNERTSTYVYYDGELGRTNYSSHNVSGGVRLSF